MTSSRLAVNSLQWMCANIAAASSKGGAAKRRGGSSNIWSGPSKKPNPALSEQPSVHLNPVANTEISSNNISSNPNLSAVAESTPDNLNATINSSNPNPSFSKSVKASSVPVKINSFSDLSKPENHPPLQSIKIRGESSKHGVASPKKDAVHSSSIQHSTSHLPIRGAYRGRGRGGARGGRIGLSQTSPISISSTVSTDVGGSIRRSSRLASRPRTTFTKKSSDSANNPSRGARRSPRAQLASPSSSSGVDDTADLTSNPSISATQTSEKVEQLSDSNEPAAQLTSSPSNSSLNEAVFSATQNTPTPEAVGPKSSRRVAPASEVPNLASSPSTSVSTQSSSAVPSTSTSSPSQASLRAATTPTSSSSQPSSVSAAASQRIAQSTSAAPSSSKSQPTQSSASEPKFTLVKSHSALPKSSSAASVATAAAATSTTPKRSLTTRSASGIARYNPRQWQVGETAKDRGRARDEDEEDEEAVDASARRDEAMHSSSSSDSEDDYDFDEEDDDTGRASATVHLHSKATSKRTGTTNAKTPESRSQVRVRARCEVFEQLEELVYVYSYVNARVIIGFLLNVRVLFFDRGSSQMMWMRWRSENLSSFSTTAVSFSKDFQIKIFPPKRNSFRMCKASGVCICN